METLTLKELAPYLPYKVKFLFIPDNDVFIMNNLDTDDLIFSWEMGETTFDLIKLVLRPISDLTKEIDHKGGRFIPIERIDDIFGDSETNYLIVDGILTENNFHSVLNNGVSYKFPNVKCYPYFIIQKLHEWHIDTENLIGRGLAIDLNTYQNQ